MVYFSQGVIYEVGSIISVSALFIICLIGLKYMIIEIVQKKINTISKLFFFLLALNVLGFLFFNTLQSDVGLSNIKRILFVIMGGYFPFTYWSKRNMLSKSILILYFYCLMILSVLCFLYYEVLLTSEYNRDNIVNNIGYMFVFLFPFIYFIKNKWMSLISIIVVILFVLLSAKRGAIIVSLVNILIYSYFNIKYALSYNSLLSKLRKIVAIILLVCGLIFIYNELILSNEFLLSRIETFESNRKFNYLALINNWYNSDSYLNLIFGFGFVSSVLYTPEKVLAHNDWLELLTSFGLLGVILYVTIIVLISFKIKTIKNDRNRFILKTILVSWIFVSMFSMWYNQIYAIFHTQLMAYVLGSIIINKKGNENTVLYR